MVCRSEVLGEHQADNVFVSKCKMLSLAESASSSHRPSFLLVGSEQDLSCNLLDCVLPRKEKEREAQSRSFHMTPS